MSGFAAALLALNLLGGADAAITVRCLRAGTCVEIGPLYRPFASRPALLVGVKAGAMGGLSVGLWMMRQRKPRAAWALTACLIVGQGIVVVHNRRMTR